MEKLKAICRSIRHERLLKKLCYEKYEVETTKLKSYASAKITSIQIGCKNINLLSIAVYRPDLKYVRNSDGKYLYNAKMHSQPDTTLFFTDRDFLYKDDKEVMRVDANFGSYYWKNVKWLNGEDLVQNHFGTDASGMNLINYISREASKRRDARIMRMHKKETDAIDAYMELIPPIPKDIDSFIKNVVTQDSRYIYYKRGKEKEAFCTFCRKDVPLNNKKAYHNAPGRCPNCGKQITYKAKGKSTLVSDDYSFAVMQNTDKGLVIRYFKVNIEFKSHYRKPKTHYFEIKRDFIEERTSFEWSCFKQRSMRWCKSSGEWNYWRSAAYLYTRNLNKVLRGTQYQYSALYQFATAYNKRFDIEKYLDTYRYFKGLEYLVKLKLINLSAAIAEGMHGKINKYGKGPLEVMNLPKDKINQAVRLNATVDMHRCMVSLQEKNLSLSDQDLRWHQENCHGNDSLAEVIPYMTYHKLKQYLIKQQPVFAQEKRQQDDEAAKKSFYRSQEFEYNIAGLFRYYADYLRMCEIVGRDMTSTQVLFPDHIVAAHDDMVEVQEIVKQERETSAIIEVIKQYLDLEFRDKAFMIRFPENVKEIIEEGNALKHCVGHAGYIEKMAKGRTLIMFLRKVDEPEKPYYTIEFDPDAKAMLQCRGKSNCSKTKEVEKFVNKYMRKISQTKMTSQKIAV